MAEEVLVAADLRADAIAGGESLLRALDETNVIVDAAFWLFSSDSSDWKLIVASPEFRTVGPKRLYKRVQSILGSLGPPKPDLSEVTVADTRDGLVQLLRSAINTGRTVNGLRFKQVTINGVLIPEVYIYRVTG